MNRSRSILFLALLLTACPKRVPLRPEEVVTEPRVLLEKIQAAEAEVVTLEGDARLKLDSPEAKGAAQMFVAVARPALLHVEVLDFFGKPLAILVSDGARFGFYDAKENRYFRGPATAENLARVLPLALPPRELAQLLLGGAPTLTAQEAALAYDEKKHEYELTLKRQPYEQILRVAPGEWRVFESRIRGPESYRLLFEEPQRYGNARLPTYITLEASRPQGRSKLELRYTTVKVNERPDPALFEVVPPEGIRVIDVDEAGRPVGGTGDLPSIPLSPGP